MTLQEKFENASIIYDADLNYVKNYEQIADDYAIGFAEWACKNNYFLYRIPPKEQEELLQRYKKEKQL